MHGGTGTLSLFLNEVGGIMDDLIIFRCNEPYLYLVSNGATRDKIIPHLLVSFALKSIFHQSNAESFNKSGKDIKIEFLERALLAIQGPSAHEIIKKGLQSDVRDSFNQLYFMETMTVQSLYGLSDDSPPIRISRCGYTGEDGYEISLSAKSASELAEIFTENSDVQPIGLAARDTLRMEAAMCLYGNELSEEVTPSEASLTWLVGKRRRALEAKSKFPGFMRILEQIENPKTVQKKRVGLIGTTGPQAKATENYLRFHVEYLNAVPH